MKLMSDIFALPLSGLDVGPTMNCTSIGDDDAIAHAINHIDALADALESLLTDYNQYRAVNEIDMTDDHSAKLHLKMMNADQVLKSYRGEK